MIGFRLSLKSFLFAGLGVVLLLFGYHLYHRFMTDFQAKNYLTLASETEGNAVELIKRTRELSPEVSKRVKQILHERFPVESLTNRLSFEKPNQKTQLLDQMSLSNRSDLLFIDFSGRGIRNEALRQLTLGNHTKLIDRAVEDPSVTLPAGVKIVSLAPVAMLVNPKEKPLDDFAFAATKRTLFPKGFGKETFQINLKESTDHAEAKEPKPGSWQDILVETHKYCTEEFAHKWKSGYVKDVDNVTGFIPHYVIGFHTDWSFYKQFNQKVKKIASKGKLPVEYFGAGEDSYNPLAKFTGWNMTRLELLSLRDPVNPKVYKSSKVPNMRELSIDQTRELDGFEKDALSKINNGADIVAGKNGDSMAMIGAIRSQKECQICHKIPIGQPLGVFTYQFERNQK